MSISKVLGVLFALTLAFVSMGAPVASAHAIPNGSSAYATVRANMRSRPTTNSKVLRVIPRGAKVYNVYGVEGTAWYKVTYRGTRAYVRQDLLRRTRPGSGGGGGGNGGRAGTIRNLGYGYADGARIERLIRNIRPRSPLRGYGSTIANAGHAWGVDPLLVAQWTYETELGTTGFNSPTNPGNLIWDAAKPYASKYGCYRGRYAYGRYWAKCPSISAGIRLWFNYVGVRFASRGYGLYEYFNRYNPCSDAYNTGQLCGSRYGDATLRLARNYS